MIESPRPKLNRVKHAAMLDRLPRPPWLRSFRDRLECQLM